LEADEILQQVAVRAYRHDAQTQPWSSPDWYALRIRSIVGNTFMNIQRYKQRLLELEKTLSAQIGHEADRGRGEFIDSAHDVGDASVADEVASEEFTEAEHNSAVLQQVRDALGRVADGTFGTCIVDGEPIEDRRLEAMPWTPYCLKHEQGLEVAASSRTPTL